MKKPRLILLPVLVSLSAAAASVDPGAPSTRPTTRPSAISTLPEAPISFATAPAPPMPHDYSIFNSRSLFMKGRISSAGPNADPGTQPSNNAGNQFKTPEEAFVFNGVTQTDEGALAFIENLATNKVLLVRVGQPIATGKITGISIHTLQYTAGGKSMRIEIGQNLAGIFAEAATRPSSSPTTQPVAAPGVFGAPAPIAGGTDEVLERMRKRREQELKGK